MCCVGDVNTAVAVSVSREELRFVKLDEVNNLHLNQRLLSTPRCSPSKYFSLAVSRTVPEPNTLFDGKPLSCFAT